MPALPGRSSRSRRTSGLGRTRRLDRRLPNDLNRRTAGDTGTRGGWLKLVESRCGAAAVGWAYLFPPLSSGGASLAQPWLRFHIPLIEPDVQISRIRLSDKASRLRPRLTVPPRGQADQAKVAIQVREWIGPALPMPDLVLETQPPTQPHRGVVVESAIRPRDRANVKSSWPNRVTRGSTCPPAVWCPALPRFGRSAHGSFRPCAECSSSTAAAPGGPGRSSANTSVRR
jgi:hypothetical protein